MFRYKNRMLKDKREEKKKNNNKYRAVNRVNTKCQYKFQLKGIQQDLIKKGIKVHKNDLRHLADKTYDKMTEEEREECVGNTTKGDVVIALNKNGHEAYRFSGNNSTIAKTHDMTRWQDKKKQTVVKKRGREYKLQSQEFVN